LLSQRGRRQAAKRAAAVREKIQPHAHGGACRLLSRYSSRGLIGAS
jgi:hypothetical protein